MLVHTHTNTRIQHFIGRFIDVQLNLIILNRKADLEIKGLVIWSTDGFGQVDFVSGGFG
jgi:hypothetical protein